MAKAKPAPVHKDLFGHELALGMPVVYAQYNTLTVGNIIKINAKTVRVKKYATEGKWQPESQQYPQDLIMINSADITVWLMKGAKDGIQLRAEQKAKENT